MYYRLIRTAEYGDDGSDEFDVWPENVGERMRKNMRTCKPINAPWYDYEAKIGTEISSNFTSLLIWSRLSQSVPAVLSFSVLLVCGMCSSQGDYTGQSSVIRW